MKQRNNSIDAIKGIAIVLVMAGVFWDKISTFFGELMEGMLGKNPLDDISKDNIPMGTPQP